MTDKDTLHRFIFDKVPVRGEYVCLEESFQAIIHQHAYPPAISRLLGEALAVAALLSASIKFNGRLSVQFRGKGKLKFLLAQCDNQLQIRGLVKWEGELSYQELMESFNDGMLVIMLDSGNLKNRYQGIVAWQGNSLVESLEGYFRESEQLATKIWLSVNDQTAAGLLLQTMPAGSDMPVLEKEIIHSHWHRVAGLTEQVSADNLMSLGYEKLLKTLYPNDDIRVFPGAPVKFNCTCTRKRGEDAIFILGQQEAEAELKDKQTLVVTCDFCNREYIFDRVDVAKIFAEHKPPSDSHLH